jgi:hypothetical protein
VAEPAGRRAVGAGPFGPDGKRALSGEQLRLVTSVGRGDRTEALRTGGRNGGAPTFRYATNAAMNWLATAVAGRACRYRSVVVIRECPMAAFTLTRSTPAATSSDPYEWRRSWNRSGSRRSASRARS